MKWSEIDKNMVFCLALIAVFVPVCIHVGISAHNEAVTIKAEALKYAVDTITEAAKAIMMERP